MKSALGIHALAGPLIAGCLAATGAWAQTSTTTTTTTTATVTAVNPAPSDPGAFDRLSPGNQRIANALFEAQTQPAPGSDGPIPMTHDQIATAKGSTGWGQVFRQMQGQGLVGAKNLGQVVSGRYVSPTATAGMAATASVSRSVGSTGGKKPTTFTTASGRTVTTGKGVAGGNAGITTATAGAAPSGSAGAGITHGNGNAGGHGGGNGHAR